MTPLRGRDGHVYVGSDDGEGRCVRCKRAKDDHNTMALMAHPFSYTGVSSAERNRLAAELAPNCLTRCAP